KLVEVIKTIPSKPRYDGTDRAWLVSINDSRYPFGKDAAWYVERFAQWAVHMQFCSVVKQREVTEDINYDLPNMKPFVGEHYMLLQPYQYQLEGVQYAVEKKRCILGDQPGLGKTLQAICTVVKAHREAVIYGESFPTLVVCPAALKVNWQREFKKFAGLNAIILDDSNRQTWHSFYDCKKADGSPLCEVFITNYESLKKFFVKRVSEGGKLTMKGILFDERVNLFKSVIIDESHKCKSGKTQQGKFVEGICKGKRFVLALTGTPVVNNNTDLIQQLKILGRLEDFGGYSRFVERYCDGPKQASNVKELNWRLWNCCFFRREKSKVLTQLPDKTRQYLQIDITNMKEYQSAESDIVKYLKQYKNASDAQVQRSMNGAVMVKMGLLKQISARGKIKAVSEFIHDVIDGGEKLIVFGYLKEVIAELKKEFPNAVTVTGSDNISQKQFAVDSFQNNPDCKLIILNYKSGGTGLTLTASSRVAFIEFPWTFSDCEQAEDRAHRNGQKNNVNCYYFLGKDTIDKYMYDVIQTKKNIANGVTGTDDQVEENMVNLAMDLFRDKL
ncbi:DEAD/DEAH box helicase, partial [Bacteroides fragilis]